ncbi:MAG: hypothetical protein FJ137_15105 [Deltaproteobacteria bacterium]|nr:hypothetical protein [Deltaproteobacteria bacterium]
MLKRADDDVGYCPELVEQLTAGDYVLCVSNSGPDDGTQSPTDTGVSLALEFRLETLVIVDEAGGPDAPLAQPTFPFSATSDVLPVGDVDCYSFTVATEGSYVITATAPFCEDYGTDPYVALTLADGSTQDNDDDVGYCSRITATLPVGTHKVCVGEAGNDETQFDMTVAITAN